MKSLVTGVGSGIGKYLYEVLGGDGLSRQNSARVLREAQNAEFDVIIHCAFNSMKDVSDRELNSYISDNVWLTRQLIQIPHRKFIFFSTVDVYPVSREVCFEEDVLLLDQVTGVYGITKLMSEAMIREQLSNYLIVRPTTLVGRYMRQNTLLRIVNGDSEPLFLSSDSCFNLITYEDVVLFLKSALELDLTGVYNLASSDNITAKNIAQMAETKMKFGGYKYSVGNISNRKAVDVYSGIRKSSKCVVENLLNSLRDDR